MHYWVYTNGFLKRFPQWRIIVHAWVVVLALTVAFMTDPALANCEVQLGTPVRLKSVLDQIFGANEIQNPPEWLAAYDRQIYLDVLVDLEKLEPEAVEYFFEVLERPHLFENHSENQKTAFAGTSGGIAAVPKLGLVLYLEKPVLSSVAGRSVIRHELAHLARYAAADAEKSIAKMLQTIHRQNGVYREEFFAVRAEIRSLRHAISVIEFAKWAKYLPTISAAEIEIMVELGFLVRNEGVLLPDLNKLAEAPAEVQKRISEILISRLNQEFVIRGVQIFTKTESALIKEWANTDLYRQKQAEILRHKQ